MPRCHQHDCQNDARYECPRCAVRYCSVDCYRTHSELCVRAFAADADKPLQGVHVTQLDRRRSNDTIRRVLQALDDSIEGDNVADTLQDVADDLDAGVCYATALQRLPRALQTDFLKSISDGRISRLVDLWQPWWLAPRVIDVENETPLPPRPLLSNLPLEAARKASPQLLPCIVDIIHAYCRMMRLHNGDWPADPLAAARTLWSYSCVLASDVRPKTIADSLGTSAASAEDTSLIFAAHTDWLTRALCDVHNCLTAAIDSGAKRKPLQRAQRKLMYFAAWVTITPEEQLTQAARNVATCAMTIRNINTAEEEEKKNRDEIKWR